MDAVMIEDLVDSWCARDRDYFWDLVVESFDGSLHLDDAIVQAFDAFNSGRP